jgi:hypothetical protein
MEPPEIYLISPRGISREELERMNAEGEKSADELRQEQQNVKDLQQLSKGIKDAVQVNKSFSRDIQRRK